MPPIENCNNFQSPEKYVENVRQNLNFHSPDSIKKYKLEDRTMKKIDN